MSDREILPGINEKQGYSTFCRNFLKYQSIIQHKLNGYAKKVSSANTEYLKIQKFLENDSETIQKAKDTCSSHKRKIDELQQQVYRARGSKEDLEELDSQMENDIAALQSAYDLEKQKINQNSKLLESAHAQSAAYLKTLKRNHDLFERMKAYKAAAQQRADALKNRFPMKADEIQSAIDQPLLELVDCDYEFEERFHSYEEASGVFQPITFMETIDYIIKPDLYPYDFLQKKDFLRALILVTALLAAGIVLAFIKHSIFIPIAIVIALFPVFHLRKKHSRQLVESMDWEEIQLYHTILAYTEKDIERLARKSENLPELSAKEYRDQSNKKIAQMEQEIQGAKDTIERCTEQLNAAREKQRALQAEYAEITADAQRANSRLHTALQKKKCGMELTENMVFLIQEYERNLADWTSRSEENAYNVNYLDEEIQTLRNKIRSLESEIREFQTKSAKLSACLEQIEQVTGGGTGISAEEKIAQLEKKEAADIACIRERYAHERERLARALDAVAERKVRELENQIAEEKTLLERAQKEQQQIEAAHRDSARILEQAKKNVQIAQQNYNEENHLLARLNSKEVWKKNLEMWKEQNRENIQMDVSEFTIADENYVMGPTGPYVLTHGCRPCVLLYETDSADANVAPLDLLKNTIHNIQLSIIWSNLPGLAKFALLNEYSEDDSLVKQMPCYTKSQLDLLYRDLNSRRQDLLKETAYGTTVKSFNDKYAQDRLQNDRGLSKEEFFRLRRECEISGDQEKKEELLQIQSDVVRLLKPTLFIFVLPAPNSDSRPMDHDGLWEKIRGGCHHYGFVPLFFIPLKKWKNAETETGRQTEFAKAKADLKQYAKAYENVIPLNKKDT